MPTASEMLGELIVIEGQAGGGKSSFLMQAPQPHAILCCDKPVISPMPSWAKEAWGYDPNLSFGKFYPPPEKDITDDKQLPSRNVFDQFIKDVQTFKIALYKGEPTFKMGAEMWPLPKTIIIEGLDFVRDHAVNWVLNTQKKHHMDEFPNVFLGWGLVKSAMDEVFNNLSNFPSVRPVNVGVAVGLDAETKREKINGKAELVETGIIDPAYGSSKANAEFPRKFRDCWLATEAVGRYIVVVKPGTRYAKYRGLRSGRFWPDGMVSDNGEIDVTLDSKKPMNHWNKLFSNTNL